MDTRPKTVMRHEISDEDLAQAAAEGEARAFETLLARHYDRLFGLSFRLTGNRAEAEDLTQDICMALPRKLKHFRGESKFTTWLYRVAVNASHDRRRRAATRAKAAEGWGPWELARQDEARATTAALDWLSEAMTRLKPDLRDTAVLVLGEDMTQAEVGSVLGISEGTVAWRMSEVKKSLRQMAQEEGLA